MVTMVIGGSGSGKSEYAEKLVTSLPGERIYIATMKPWDEECLARIEKHQRARAGRGFRTIERYTNLAELKVPAGSNVLLECLTNLVANELYDPEGKGEEAVIAGIESLAKKCSHLTIVTGEVFSGGTAYLDDTLSYLKALARIGRRIAVLADQVTEVVAGLPNQLKRMPEPGEEAK